MSHPLFKKNLNPSSINFESWINVLDKKSLSLMEQALWLKGLKEHPEWVNQAGPSQETPLIKASKRGHVEVVKALIQAGADIGLQDDHDRTALILASNQGQVDVVKTLIEAGADLNHRNYYGSALMYAANQGYLDVVKTLIETGANINLQNDYGKTPLMCASRHGHSEIVQVLIDAGAALNLQNKANSTALMIAASYGHKAVVNTLIKMRGNFDQCIDLNLKDQEGFTALMRASHRGSTEMVKELIQRGADPLIRNQDRQTALDLAKESGCKEVIDLLEAYTDKQALSQVINPMKKPSSSPARSNKMKSMPSSKRPRL